MLTDNASQCVECLLNLIVTLFIRTRLHLHTFLQSGHPAPKESMALTRETKTLSPKQGHHKEGGEGDCLIKHHPSFQKGTHDGHCRAI